MANQDWIRYDLVLNDLLIEMKQQPDTELIDIGLSSRVQNFHFSENSNECLPFQKGLQVTEVYYNFLDFLMRSAKYLNVVDQVPDAGKFIKQVMYYF